MPDNKLFGKNAYYYDMDVPQDKLVKILSYGVLQDENGIMYFDESNKCVYANKRAFSMFYVMEDLELLETTFNAWLEELGIKKDATTWCRVYKSDGKERLYKVRYRHMLDDDNNLVGHVYVISNITDVIENDLGEQYRLTHDDLTHLYNKEGFFAGVRDLLSTDDDRSYVIVVSNIKDFKLINQLFGLDKGNDILITIADMLSQKVREEDIYGRITGDHFALCMPKERFNAKEFKKSIEEITGQLTSETYSIHMQLGVYEIVDRNMDISLMCDRAFMACKTITRDNICEVAWYNDEMLVNALLEKEILSSFDFAILNRQFGIYLQPQVDANGKLLGAEALARWLHPENGVIEPGVFIDVLEKADLIYKLDKYIWELAARQLYEWKGTPRENISISVNVSPKDLYYLDIMRVFSDLVEKYGIDPKRLNIEITETAVTSDVGKCAKLIRDLQEKGFVVEIDDFGSGYSSLNMLKDIDADVLKIDMGFLYKTENQKRAQVILNYTIDMAHELGMKVITEGVETRKQLQFLIGVGCEMFQGYFFNKPMPVEGFELKYQGV